MSVKLECVIDGVEDLRMPRVYRVHATCGEAKLDFELHNDIIPKAMLTGKNMRVEVSSEKESCLQHYFCGQGYVVSVGRVGENQRVVISLHGFLVVLKTPSHLGLNPMDQVFVGADFEQ